jgi:hypothetical protein
MPDSEDELAVAMDEANELCAEDDAALELFAAPHTPSVHRSTALQQGFDLLQDWPCCAQQFERQSASVFPPQESAPTGTLNCATLQSSNPTSLMSHGLTDEHILVFQLKQ